jgi:hypothetical protein
MLAKVKAKVKHIYSTGVIDDHHLQLSKYFYNTGHSVLCYKTFLIIIYCGCKIKKKQSDSPFAITLGLALALLENRKLGEPHISLFY